MRNPTPFVLFSLLLSTDAARVAAAETDPVTVVEGAVAVYKAEGAEAFVRKALEQGPMEGNKDALAQANMLRAVETYYGSYQSFEVFESVDLGASTRLLYLVFNYESGPLFAAMTFYRNGERWCVINFKFHTEVWQVWPERLLAK